MAGLLYIASCSLGFISWLQDHLLPCPFKYLTGIDCPGCGFQRAMIALFKGDVGQSFGLYPAAIPLIVISLFTLADKRYRIDKPNGVIKKAAYITVGAMIVVSYTLKMAHLYAGR